MDNYPSHPYGNQGQPYSKSPLKFFIVVFALTLPFWVIGALAKPLPPPINLSLSSFSVVCPFIAACILVYREEKPDGIRRLLKRIFDVKRIKHKIWYVPIMFLLPGIYVLVYEVMRLMGRALPESHIPFLWLLILLVVFFLLAVGEETGWTGYATDIMQGRWSALTTGIMLGLVWGIWHVVLDIKAHHTWAFIAWQHFFYSVVLRILLVWLYNNTGKSLFTATLFHAMDNVSFSLFPNNGSHYDPAITGAITAVIAMIVTFFWGSKTLASFRYARPQASLGDGSPV